MTPPSEPCHLPVLMVALFAMTGGAELSASAMSSASLFWASTVVTATTSTAKVNNTDRKNTIRFISNLLHM